MSNLGGLSEKFKNNAVLLLQTWEMNDLSSKNIIHDSQVSRGLCFSLTNNISFLFVGPKQFSTDVMCSTKGPLDLEVTVSWAWNDK